ncbi:MAG: indole-3-glycerol phosphate synthase TrpC [Bacteroidales bacterium]|nr:indole-3-glycerol phosphate synthase TrpC [Bacteroidales bacterium]
MTILEEIIKHKKAEVEENKSIYPVKLLERSIYFTSETVSLKKYLLRNDKKGIIAEFKRKSPSKGMLNEYAPVEQVSIGYMQAGASALSILTDKKYFNGKNEDLTVARKFNYCPILRKDFIIDEYQIIEAKSIGADAILLIAAVLEKEKIKQLSELAKSLKLEILFEVHNKEELEKVSSNIDIIGVNNRNLNDFKTDINTSIELSVKIPDEFIKISESGISSVEAIANLRKCGFKGFLIGEYFMKSANPSKACAEFIKKLNNI